MHILNIMQCTNLGGMEQSSLRLMQGFKTEGHTCEVLSLRKLGALSALLRRDCIEGQDIDYAGLLGWRSVRRYQAYLSGCKADAVLMTGHNLMASVALGRFCESRRVLAIHFHHAGVNPRWQWRMVYRLACSQFNAITFPCDFIRLEAESIYPPVKRIAHTIRNPLEIQNDCTEEERLRARIDLGLCPQSMTVGNAGWLIKRKRFDVFLAVAKQIRKMIPSVQFVVAGDGPERATLEQTARQIGIADSVRFLGWRSNLDSFYNAIDLLLFNSDWDALPTTPLEALSRGIPVVGSCLNGGIRELVAPPAAMIQSTHDVLRMAEDAALLVRKADSREIREQSRGIVRQHCDPVHIRREMLRLLQ